jgi:uncharacterized protein (TIGR03083 family)
MSDRGRAPAHTVPSGTSADDRQGALQAAVARTAALLRAVPDPHAAVPGLEWTVAETAAHLVAELHDYTGFLTGKRRADDRVGGEPGQRGPSEHGAISNAAQLDEFAERDLSRLADMLVPAAREFAAAAAERPVGETVLADNGLSMTLSTMTAALLGEQVVHGLDIARAAGVRWSISRADALVVVDGVMAMVPDYVDRRRAAGLHRSYELRFRGGVRYRLVLDDGTASITEPGQRVDCWISADPVAFVLVGYGRAGQWGPIIRGKILAGGRKPWLGLSFGGLITGP